MSIELLCGTQVLLNEIADKQFKRKDIALTYAISLKSSDETDYAKVNNAIIQRWSLSGLVYIKELAWKMIKEKQENNDQPN